MAVSALLRTTTVTVPPGGAARCHVLIRNSSAVVDQFAFAVRGDVADWTGVKPAKVNLMPQQEITVELTFAPPRTPEVLAGEHPFALQVASREDPAGSVVQEGVVTVEPFTEVEAGVVPVTSTGRRRGRHTLAVDNLGNHAHGAEVVASDPDNRLTFKIRPHAPRLEPGTAAFVRVKARPKRYFWKGPDRRLPFVVKVLVPGQAAVEVEAVLEQLPLIPRRFFWLFSALLALLIVLVIVVTALLRQKPVSIAGPAPSSAPAGTTSAASSAPAAPPSASSTPAPTTQPVTLAPQPVPGGTGGTGGVQRGTAAAPPVTTAFTVRSQAYPGVGGGPQLFSYVVPPGPRHRVTAVVLRAPAGDTGQVQVRHGDRVLTTTDLAEVARAGTAGLPLRPAQPPLVAPGELVTLAVTCANPEDPCTPTGVFTAALVR